MQRKWFVQDKVTFFPIKKKNAIPGVGLSFFLGLIRPARRRNRILSVITKRIQNLGTLGRVDILQVLTKGEDNFVESLIGNHQFNFRPQFLVIMFD